MASKGFVPIPAWRSCYFHPEKKLFLIACVGDFKLAGPAAEGQAGWDFMRGKSDVAPDGIDMDPRRRWVGT